MCIIHVNIYKYTTCKIPKLEMKKPIWSLSLILLNLPPMQYESGLNAKQAGKVSVSKIKS